MNLTPRTEAKRLILIFIVLGYVLRHDVKYLDIRKSCVWGWFGCVLHKCFNGFPFRFIVWFSAPSVYIQGGR
jgi:hypothetical protein